MKVKNEMHELVQSNLLWFLFVMKRMNEMHELVQNNLLWFLFVMKRMNEMQPTSYKLYVSRIEDNSSIW